MIRRLGIVIFLFSIGINLQAQHDFLQSRIFTGKILKHRNTITFDTGNPVKSFDISLIAGTYGKHNWEKYWGYPDYEFSYQFVSFGNAEVLGTAHAFIPGFKFKLINREKHQFNFHLGLGFSYSNKIYSEIDNPENISISTNFNNATSLKFSYQNNFSRKAFFQTGISFLHISNGGTKMPNKGLNSTMGYVGIGYKIKNRELKSMDGDSDYKTIKRKYGLNIYYSHAVKQYAVDNKPTFYANVISLGGFYRLNDFNHILIGWEYEFHHDEYNNILVANGTEEEAKEYARLQMLFFGHEFLFGRVSARLQLGIYVQNKQTNYLSSKLFANYRIPLYGEGHLYVGIMMKSHQAVANYVGLVGGFEF